MEYVRSALRPFGLLAQFALGLLVLPIVLIGIGLIAGFLVITASVILSVVMYVVTETL